jgi:hypothetical protein
MSVVGIAWEMSSSDRSRFAHANARVDDLADAAELIRQLAIEVGKLTRFRAHQSSARDWKGQNDRTPRHRSICRFP